MRVQDAAAAVRAFAREAGARPRGRTRRPTRSAARWLRVLPPPACGRLADRTARRPAASVSCSCSATSSSSLSATAMPPCAYSDEDSRRLSLATTSTRPGFGQFDGRAQAGHAGADHQKIRIHRVQRSSNRVDASMVQRLYADLPAWRRRSAVIRAVVERGLSALPRSTFRRRRQGVRGHHRGCVAASGARAPARPARPCLTKFCISRRRRAQAAGQVEALAEQMVRRGGDRSSVVVAFGGGIVNDMGGFLAAIFMRGIPVIQVPTTLLAQVDAAIGGKTGVEPGRRART